MIDCNGQTTIGEGMATGPGGIGVSVAERCQSLVEGLRDVEVMWREPLSKHTTFRVGGPVLLLVRPLTEDALAALLARIRDLKIPYVVLGGGSNIIAPDEALDAVAVQPSFCRTEIRQSADLPEGGLLLDVGAGVTVTRLLKYCERNGLGGVEFLTGIPGTFGGALVMNAGAGGGCVADALLGMDIMDDEGDLHCVPRTDLHAGYRFMGVRKGSIVLGGRLRLKKTSSESVREAIRDIMKQRKAAQPIEFPSAGCVFKNPPGDAAGALIDRAGLKGFRVGDAEVSRKHANWVVNMGNAKARDIMEVIGHIEKRVFDEFGVRLEKEVRILEDEIVRIG